MSNVFFASDHHLGHENMMKFFKRDGLTPLRPFVDAEDMNETIIENHNRVVGPKDTCWFLGDVVINRRFLSLVQRMNGRKRLILGNHDIFKNKDYLNAGFEDLHAFRKFDRFVATHIPVHPSCVSLRWNVNVHGHTHDNLVTENIYLPEQDVNVDVPDPRYINVCLEHIHYTPISMEDVLARIDNVR